MDRYNKHYFTSIDFIDFVPSQEVRDEIVINLSLKNQIHHTFPKIDRCCKFSMPNIEFDGIDNMERINCDMSQEDFTEKYINRRRPVMISGCQENWAAKNWTVENLFNRYNSSWYAGFYQNEDQECMATSLHGHTILKMMNAGYHVKAFNLLPKSLKGWATDVSTKVDLLDEYDFPSPMPQDMFQDAYISSNQAYIMIATNETGQMKQVMDFTMHTEHQIDFFRVCNHTSYDRFWCA